MLNSWVSFSVSLFVACHDSGRSERWYCQYPHKASARDNAIYPWGCGSLLPFIPFYQGASLASHNVNPVKGLCNPKHWCSIHWLSSSLPNRLWSILERHDLVNNYQILLFDRCCRTMLEWKKPLLKLTLIFHFDLLWYLLLFIVNVTDPVAIFNFWYLK